MLSWYEKNIILKRYPDLYVEAGMREGLIIAILAMLFGGDTEMETRYIAEVTGVPMERLTNRLDAVPDDIGKQIHALINERDSDPLLQAYLRQAKQVADDARRAQQEVIVAPLSDQFITDQVIDAVIAIEGASSSFIGSSGDTGVMQILPATWNEMNERYFEGKYPYGQHALNVGINRMFGKQYLIHLSDWLSTKPIKGDLLFITLATYNGGMGNVSKCEFDPEQIRVKMPSAYDYARRTMNLIEVV